jgi:hypothetical protein
MRYYLLFAAGLCLPALATAVSNGDIHFYTVDDGLCVDGTSDSCIGIEPGECCEAPEDTLFPCADYFSNDV